MMPLRYLQMDVFAARPGAGNALGAVIEGERFDPLRMQAFAAWTNLSETIFLLPPTTAEADYRVCIFTPRQELPFAGHPSVGAAWAAIRHRAGVAREDATGAGMRGGLAAGGDRIWDGSMDSERPRATRAPGRRC